MATLGSGGEVKLQKPSLHLAGVNQFMPVARREPDGRFVFEHVAPGEYRLIANAGGPAAEGAAVTVTVGDTDQTVNVRTNAGATMTWRVVVDGQPPDQTLLDGLRIRAFPLRLYDGDGAKVAVARVKPDGGFTLEGLRGATRFEVDGSGAALLAIKRGAEDITPDVLQFLGEERLTGVVIEMNAKTRTVDNRVTHPIAKPVTIAAGVRAAVKIVELPAVRR